MRNQEYWMKRNQMRDKARAHTEEMSVKYAAEIEDCVNRTVLYDCSNIVPKSSGRIPVCEVMPLDVVSAIFSTEIDKVSQGKVCVLNFASFKEPGGMFLEGSTAQEESLCHSSFLYNVLSSDRLSLGYEYNKTCLNRALYQDHAFYTPDVVFESGNRLKRCDVITCAAPNFSAANRYCSVTQEENSKVLRQRIRFVLDVMATQNVEYPILGAYGCGVFGQSPKEVAQIFKEELMSGIFPFRRVLFAIIPSDIKTLDAFRSVYDVKIYTSYYNNWKQLDATRKYVPVRISASAPKGFPFCESIPEVYPTWDLLSRYKQGLIDDSVYTKEYLEQLNAVNRQDILARLSQIAQKHQNKDIVLLCWEGKDKFCHRHLLADWLDCEAKEL